jgi:hypothetical protein
MNRILVDVYLTHRKQQWGKGLEGMSFDSDRDLEDIVLGDVEQRDKLREKYLSDKFEKHLERVIKE